MKRQTIPTILAALIVAVALAFVSIRQKSNLYTVNDLEQGNTVACSALAVNAASQVAGYTGASPERMGVGFLYSAGRSAALSDPDIRSEAFSLNASGTVVGRFFLRFDINHACRFSKGKIADLGTLGGKNSAAYAVNAAGDIAGVSAVNGRQTHAFLYADGHMQDLGTLGGALSEARGINDRGQVVGFAATADARNHAFLYTDGTMQDLGTFGGEQSFAFAINNAGQIVGSSDKPDGATHAFLYQNGAMQDLGSLNHGITSIAYGINAQGEIVGGSDPGVGEMHAFVYKNGRMHDLNRLISPRSGWLLQEARAINERGQIAGIGTFQGKTRAFLLTPQ